MKILEINIENINYQETITKIDSFIASGKPHQIVTVNPEIVMHAQNSPQYKKIINASDLQVADGAGLWWAAKYTGQQLTHRVTGVDLIDKLCKHAANKKYSVFFLGGYNNVGHKTAQKLKEKYPNLKIAGTFEGHPIINNSPTEKADGHNLEIVKRVTQAKPDILLVAYGAPKQEQFIARYFNELNIPVMIGVGGSFDFISGTIKRAPTWMQSLHLEWLFRLINQPSRAGRIFTATIKFPLAVIFKKQNHKKD